MNWREFTKLPITGSTISLDYWLKSWITDSKFNYVVEWPRNSSNLVSSIIIETIINIIIITIIRIITIVIVITIIIIIFIIIIYSSSIIISGPLWDCSTAREWFGWAPCLRVYLYSWDEM